jgi:hypothetical protein
LFGNFWSNDSNAHFLVRSCLDSANGKVGSNRIQAGYFAASHEHLTDRSTFARLSFPGVLRAEKKKITISEHSVRNIQGCRDPDFFF